MKWKWAVLMAATTVVGGAVVSYSQWDGWELNRQIHELKLGNGDNVAGLLIDEAPRSIDPLIAIYRDPKVHRYIRADAVGILSQINDPRARQVVYEAASDRELSVRSMAHWGLKYGLPSALGFSE